MRNNAVFEIVAEFELQILRFSTYKTHAPESTSNLKFCKNGTLGHFRTTILPMHYMPIYVASCSTRRSLGSKETPWKWERG